ncbi:hypothetical protein LOY70_10955 [Pseudomonas sp. B21-054]|uniref:hypothetical protein n=1 Tax=Pseudomonas sp. B21-054 TaxID=2895494 RepID=UPI0022303CAB|nr:hypothetical protein [Pseudomonas sp. B21-054]UZE20082.1 hypothetical protein LOY70_10955 [Pseudomonas sp. B21-054]
MSNCFHYLASAAFWTILAGCSQNLQHNEGAVQIAHSTDGIHVVSVFLLPSQKAPAPITKGEAISVKLTAAYICDFRERLTPRDWFSSSNTGAVPCNGGDGNASGLGSAQNTRGEIAILANVAERTTTTGLTFNPADIQRNGRVVYYNEDVRESGQLINALNIPLYGPKTYEGGTFFMDVAIMELDNDENEQGRHLLQELAKVGSAAYAPGTPVLNVLNTLGGALLGANGDDVELRYQMEFDPTYTGKTLASSQTVLAPRTSRAPLQEGYYAIIRMERRDELPDFASMRITEGSHSPYISDPTGTLFKGGSWLLIRVAREDHTQAAPQDFATKLTDVLNPSGKTEATRIAELEAIVKAVEGVHKAPAKK